MAEIKVAEDIGYHRLLHCHDEVRTIVEALPLPKGAQVLVGVCALEYYWDEKIFEDMKEKTLRLIKLVPANMKGSAESSSTHGNPPHRFDVLLSAACESYAKTLRDSGDQYCQAAFWCDVSSVLFHHSIDIEDVLKRMPFRYWIVLSAAFEVYAKTLISHDNLDWMSSIEHLSEAQVEVDEHIKKSQVDEVGERIKKSRPITRSVV